MKTNRRTFVKNTSLTAAGVGLSLVVPHKIIAKIVQDAPSDRLNLGVIGLGMGCRDLQGALSNSWVNCVAMCDVNKERLNEQVANFKKQFPNQTSSIKLYTDFRELLGNKDIDGVIIATPDHWHPYIFAEALKAGKAVYIEKPVANSIEEVNLMVDLQKKHQRIVTTGLWQTSQKYFIGANEILKSDVLGDVYKVQIWLCSSTNPRAGTKDTSAPSTLDWDMWLGPAPKRAFNQSVFRGWRGFWDYGGGQQTDWGVHWIDSAFDGLKILGLSNRDEFPKAVFSTAFKHPETFNETPSCQTTVFQFENFHMEWTQQEAYLYNRNQGVAWIGSKATLVCNREGYELIPNKNRDGSTTVDPIRFDGSFEEGGVDAHATNWCNCIRENSMNTNSPIEKGAFATILAHMGNISYRTGTKVIYDSDNRKFVDNPGADLYFGRKYRTPWELPRV
ncbi:MAG: Gfo/Idh/MocA family oxidoreductase [Dysgonamonadaceae bacterium]|nr:Gfo/Idh/MocA family oxidoreductase [Dysgonamonadaceae bacterium]MDD3900697.1 Gfo/Idh/MocA family oxidoreductase [Dysgonamonadaceae bacterium]